MSDFAVIGRVLSHGYLCCGFLPTRIAFPVLASVLLGPSTSIPPDILVQSFSDYLSPVDNKTITDALALKEFTQDIKTQIVNIIARFGCRENPTPGNLKCQLSRLAHHHFNIQPFAAISTMNSGIPDKHKPFWQTVSVVKLTNSLIASPSKVLDI